MSEQWCPREGTYKLKCEYAERLRARVAELEAELRDMRILGGKTLAERNDALARVAELEDILGRCVEVIDFNYMDGYQVPPELAQARAVLAKGKK